MNAVSSARRSIRLIAIASLLTAAALVSVYSYGLVIHAPKSDGPVERWIEIGFERHHLEGLNAASVLVSEEEYAADKQRLVSREDEIALEHEFPHELQDLQSYLNRRRNGRQWPVAFWIALGTSIAVSIAAVSWLRGASFADRQVGSVKDSPS